MGSTEYYSSVKKIKVMDPGRAWMELEKNTLNEGTQTQTDKYRVDSLMWSS